jgi:hypothetical protein
MGNVHPFVHPPGSDVMIFKIFSPKNFAKKTAFLTQNKAENWEKSQKIVIITSTPGLNTLYYLEG